MTRCPVPECSQPVKAGQLLCRTHWFRVPKRIRDDVWREYRADAGSVPHRRACVEAIDAATTWKPKP